MRADHAPQALSFDAIPWMGASAWSDRNGGECRYLEHVAAHRAQRWSVLWSRFG